MTERDLFVNFERMRREMDALFGDMLGRSGRGRRPGFWPPVDVAYTSDPPRAIVTVELAGIDRQDLGLEILGPKLILWGRRPPTEVEGDVYQRVEIERGPFRRVVDLGTEVRVEDAKATYEDGMLRVELPLVRRATQGRPVRVRNAEGDT
jgi:HSP20 family protein